MMVMADEVEVRQTATERRSPRPMPFFVLFTVVPLLEIVIFAWVGGRIGVLGTIGMVLGCAALGALLLRHQGTNALRKAQLAISEGRLPSTELADGLVLLVAGVLLITPGFLSDAFALLLLLPGFRHLVRRWLVVKLISRMQRTGAPGGPNGFSGVTFHSFGGQLGGPPFGDRTGPPGGRAAKDVEVIDDDDPRPR